MKIGARVLPGEWSRFTTLALLLFINSLVLESNEVVATSGFVSRVGAEQILWVWAIDMLIVILTSGAYSLIVDRTQRGRLAIRLSVSFSLVYVLLFLLFVSGVPDWLSYPLLTVINDQQWMLLPLLIWTLANDLFSTAAAKRLFPLLGVAALVGGILGNGLAAGVAQSLAESLLGRVALLLVNAGLILVSAIILAVALRRIKITTHQSRQDETVLDTLREGLAFVREVPSFRYLSLAMILLGVGLNVIEYQLIVSALNTYPEPAALQAFYGTFRAAVWVMLLLVQGVGASWLLNRIGFKSIFAFMPGALLIGLFLVLAWPVLIGVAIGDFLTRITLSGIDEPSRRAFQGMVPDERRGRVSVFLDGYLYPLGSVLSCGMVGAVVFAVGQNLLAPEVGRTLYLSLGGACAGIALWAITQFRGHYDESMLNWRLKRRRRLSTLEDLEL
ncbi:MAG: Npt1/Npt2 family nucleotide transporter [Candidatus Bipolaricaulia bacterium]